MLKDYSLPPLKGGVPGHAIIFLHGLGDRGDGGLLSIGQIWQRALPDCAMFCPDAPFPFDTMPPEFGGRQWFSLQDLAPEKILAGTKTAAPYLNDYIDHILKTCRLTVDKIALVGFSQGTIMALYVAMRRKDPVACVIGYSGLLSGGEALAAEKKSAPPVLLVHGMMDGVVPYAMMAVAEQGLKAAGIPVTTATSPHLEHGIDDAGIAAGLTFLRRHLV